MQQEELADEKPDLPAFYYEIDDDIMYSGEEVLKMCKTARNVAITDCKSLIEKTFHQVNQKYFIERMEFVLSEAMI